MKVVTLLVDIAVDDYDYSIDQAIDDVEAVLDAHGPAKWKTVNVLLPEADE